jgi:16S rRNA (guanine1207-N2)-methyltransferase
VDGDAVRTLFLPFETGELPVPGAVDRWLFLNAVVPAQSDVDWRHALTCVQGFRPEYLSLLRAGYTALPELDAGSSYSGALVLLGKHREANRHNIHSALARVREGAPVLVAGAKIAGVESIRKEMTALVSVEAKWSKHHAQVFQINRPSHWVSTANLNTVSVEVKGHSLRTAPGMFSHKAVDAGSQLLSSHLGELKGTVADFGAGWGYLSAMALLLSRGIESIDLYEADYASLQSAKSNLEIIAAPATMNFHWSDLTKEPPAKNFDSIIMNPPFHSGRHSEPDLGKRFTEVAAKALKSGGKLFMVANKQLPYENTIENAFRRYERIGEDRLYKVIRAVK